MAKVNYHKCDICGDVLKTNILCGGYLNGYTLLNKLFNGLDICTDCMKKINKLSSDINLEEMCADKIDYTKYQDNKEMQVAYFEGVQDVLDLLSHNRLNKS